MTLRQVAQRVRHMKGLENAEGLWRVLRKPYLWVLNRGGRGVEVDVGGVARVRMPAEYAGGSWEQYEPETTACFVRWVHENPDGIVLDVGSAVGIFSAIALFASEKAEAVAFDSDLSSLAATRRMCRHATGDRLRLVYGFLAESPTDRSTLDVASAAAQSALRASGVTGDVGTTKYTCLNDEGVGAIPARRLDDLFPGPQNRPILIKCDVEGAELLVLHGADAFLRRERPDMLLSVHPPALPRYGHSTAQVRALLDDLGYDIECIAVDHEEHWWCEARRALVARAE